jgi:hypothetical protein
VRLMFLCALGATITVFALVGCSDTLEPPSTEQALAPELATAKSGRGTMTICHAAGPAGTTRYSKLTLSPSAVYGPGGHLNQNGTTRAGHEQDFVVTSTRACPPQPVTTGALYICKIAGAGVAVGTTFTFTVNGNPVTATATADGSSNLSPSVCASAGTFTLGATVVIRETVPAGQKISSIAFNFGGSPGELINFDQAFGTQEWIGMTVAIGPGDQFAVFTNAVI